MKVIRLREDANTIILVAVILLNTLYESELGGSDSIYNTVSILLLLVFFFLNHHIKPTLSFFFAVPLTFLALSVLINISTLQPGGYNTALAISMGYLLLTLKPPHLDRILMQRLIVAYLIGCVVLSLYYLVDNPGTRLIAGNTNFNQNENAASIFFVGCLILSFEFIHSSWLRVIPIIFTLLILTTGSRAGVLVGIMLWVVYVLFKNNYFNRLTKMNSVIKPKRVLLLAFILIPFATVYLIPDSVEYLMSRFLSVGIQISDIRGGREYLWLSALHISLESVSSFFFGHGPSSAAILLEYGTHSSYVEAFTSVGWPFLIFTLVAIGFLFSYHIKNSQGNFVLYAIPILIYGVVETVIFNGLSNLWYIFIFLSLYYRSRDSNQLPNRGNYLDYRY